MRGRPGRPRKNPQPQQGQDNGTYIASAADIDSAAALVAEQAETMGVVTLDDFDEGRLISSSDDLPPNLPKQLPNIKGEGMVDVKYIRVSKAEPDKHPMSNLITLVNRSMAPKVSERFFGDNGICFMGDLYIAAIAVPVLQQWEREMADRRDAKVRGAISQDFREEEWVPSMGRSIAGTTVTGIESHTRVGAKQIDRRGLSAKLAGD
jgi:hypothetical protein